MLDEEPIHHGDSAPEIADRRKADDALSCAACGALVTRQRWAISRRDAHEHVVFNPAGHLFRVRCFSQAPGASPIGPAQEDFSWFPGYPWQIALCLECGQHLGWHYPGRDGLSGFWGLNAKRLRQESDVS